jgi:hypothetical protein
LARFSAFSDEKPMSDYDRIAFAITMAFEGSAGTGICTHNRTSGRNRGHGALLR